MQVALRRLIVISAIAIGGATTGIVLGNFVAGGQKMTGLEELAVYNAMFAPADDSATGEDEAQTSLAAGSGPTSYQCQGCDAHLGGDIISADTDAGYEEPLPTYRPEETSALMAVPVAARSPSPAATPATSQAPALQLSADRARLVPITPSAPPLPSLPDN